jgi:glyoxylase-like metal-dependent hydrolase (beta-lactamase superfamily II)
MQTPMQKPSHQTPHVETFYDEATATLSYVVADMENKVCVVIDPVLDINDGSAEISTNSADRIVRFIKDCELRAAYVLETHAHADHLSAGYYLKQKLGAKIGISSFIGDIQRKFAGIYSESAHFAVDGSQFDILLVDQQTLSLGALQITALHSPGHTPACMAYHIGDALFVGDTLFMPDSGTARCDFPGGNASDLYFSIKRLLELPESTRVFVCHDYQPNGRPLACEASIRAHRMENIHLRDGVSEVEFVKMRTARDRQLPMPKLMIPSMQVNIRAGALPRHPVSARPVITLPINAFGGDDLTEILENQ